MTCSYGVHGFTDTHREAFRQYAIRQVHIAYDNDKAGNEAVALVPEPGVITTREANGDRVALPTAPKCTSGSKKLAEQNGRRSLL
ncbi:toprim domain-containing protein [Xenorhabdus griffiniae]|uniref:toprim domain-containing protein n=1 Tax=Xenorhabdus griffiniae TaxID=351672 RepID=UPI002358D100|nr:toprim domain-containing protein [Xenorhabdus griffiniae]MDC9606994.1 hypothetical protein [Xenorhabdus griffiniae]